MISDCITATPSQNPNDREGHVRLRSSYKNLSVNEVQKMSHVKIIKSKEWGYYGYSTIKHDYVLKAIQNEKVVIDHATGLMWHQSGSTCGMNWEKAHRWIERLNTRGYAGYHDWRLPTVEEAASLLEPEKVYFYLPYNGNADEYNKLLQSAYLQQKSGDQFLRNKKKLYKQSIKSNPGILKEDKKGMFKDHVFDKTQGWIWTGDNYQHSAAWRVDYFSGLVDWDIYYYNFYFVRPVRTVK